LSASSVQHCGQDQFVAGEVTVLTGAGATCRLQQGGAASFLGRWPWRER